MTDGLPYYIDDPLVDTRAHRLNIHRDEQATTRGYVPVFGTCSCGEWTSPTYDRNGVLEAFDGHMHLVQVAAHEQEKPS